MVAGMDLELWLLLPDGLDLRAVAISDTKVVIETATSATSARCPKCTFPSRHVHSYRYRTISDLPWLGLAVRFLVRVRHFRCRNEQCPQQFFAERVTNVVDGLARRTKRLDEALVTVACELGGKAGVRVADAMGIDISRDSVLKLIQRKPAPEARVVSALSVDDWCWKKRHGYGTMWVDMEHIAPWTSCPTGTWTRLPDGSLCMTVWRW